MPGLELVGAHRACPGIFHLSLTTAGCFNLWSPTEGKAELHLRQLSLKYKQAILQDDLLQRSKFSIVLLGACVLHVPTAQWPVEERNLILTPPCWCWCCSRDSFYIWQECYLRLSTAAEKIHLWYLIWSPPCPQASWLYQQDCCTAAVALAMPRISAFYTLAFASPSLMCFFAPNPLPDYQRQSEVGHAWSKLIQFWNGDDVGCGLVAGEWAMWNVKEERTRRQAVNIPS